MTMTLVDIPTTDYIQGISAASGISGERQRIDSRALPNLLAFAKAYRVATGLRMLINEGARSRPRQDYFWANQVKLGITAARPYTSNHDEILHGNAVDIGGLVQFYGSSGQKWAAANGPRFGVRPTGLKFAVREPWHFDIDLIITAASAASTIPTEEDMPLNDTDLAKIADVVRKNSGSYIVQSNTRSALCGAGGVTYINKEEFAELSQHYHVVSTGTNERAFDVEVAVHLRLEDGK